MQKTVRNLFPRRIDERRLTIAIRALFGVSVLLITVLSFLSHENNKNLFLFTEKTEHSQSVITALNQLKAQLYQESNHFSSLNKYDGSILKSSHDEFKVSIMKLQSLCADSEVQQLRLRNLDNLTNEWFVYLSTVDSSTTPHFFQSQKDNFLGSSDFILTKMLDVEGKLYHNRLQSKFSYKALLHRYNLMIMIVSIGFLGTSFVLLDREHSRNRYYRKVLEVKIETLKQSNNELEQYAYVASHDLQEPIRKIIAFNERLILRHKDSLDTDAISMLEKIGKSAVRMQSLINDLLSFSKVSKPEINKTETDLNEIMDEVLENLSDVIQQKGALIQKEILPLAYVYPTQVMQLFQNLVSNSLKYSRPDITPIITINYEIVLGHEIPDSIEIHKDAEFFKINFVDNGIGFNQEYVDKIFVIFQRLHGKEKFQGTGIGLAICKKVVANHDGYLTATGKDQNGAIFSVYLPA